MFPFDTFHRVLAIPLPFSSPELSPSQHTQKSDTTGSHQALPMYQTHFTSQESPTWSPKNIFTFFLNTQEEFGRFYGCMATIAKVNLL